MNETRTYENLARIALDLYRQAAKIQDTLVDMFLIDFNAIEEEEEQMKYAANQELPF